MHVCSRYKVSVLESGVEAAAFCLPERRSEAALSRRHHASQASRVILKRMAPASVRACHPEGPALFAGAEGSQPTRRQYTLKCWAIRGTRRSNKIEGRVFHGPSPTPETIRGLKKS